MFYNYKVLHNLCSYFSLMDLIHHLQTVHNHTIEVKKLQFTSIAEFKTWKEEEEIKSHSNYV